jgi:hypothetical protein
MKRWSKVNFRFQSSVCGLLNSGPVKVFVTAVADNVHIMQAIKNMDKMKDTLHGIPDFTLNLSCELIKRRIPNCDLVCTWSRVHLIFGRQDWVKQHFGTTYSG